MTPDTLPSSAPTGRVANRPSATGSLRRGHRWVGAAALLGLLLLAVTGVMLIHGGAWRLFRYRVPTVWFPGYRSASYRAAETRPTATLALPNGVTVIGTKHGLYYLGERSLWPVQDLPKREVMSLAARGERVLVAMRGGAWLLEGGRWRAIYRGEIFGAGFSDENRLAVASWSRGLLISSDGGRAWQPLPDLAEAMASLPLPAELPLTRVLYDVHTGVAFLGTDGDWIWVDALGGALLLLTVSGGFLWLRARRRSRHLRTSIA